MRRNEVNAGGQKITENGDSSQPVYKQSQHNAQVDYDQWGRSQQMVAAAYNHSNMSNSNVHHGYIPGYYPSISPPYTTHMTTVEDANNGPFQTSTGHGHPPSSDHIAYMAAAGYGGAQHPMGSPGSPAYLTSEQSLGIFGTNNFYGGFASYFHGSTGDYSSWGGQPSGPKMGTMSNGPHGGAMQSVANGPPPPQHSDYYRFEPMDHRYHTNFDLHGGATGLRQVEQGLSTLNIMPTGGAVEHCERSQAGMIHGAGAVCPSGGSGSGAAVNAGGGGGGGSGKKSWASIASQPAKMQTLASKPKVKIPIGGVSALRGGPGSGGDNSWSSEAKVTMHHRSGISTNGGGGVGSGGKTWSGGSSGLSAASGDGRYGGSGGQQHQSNFYSNNSGSGKYGSEGASPTLNNGDLSNGHAAGFGDGQSDEQDNSEVLDKLRSENCYNPRELTLSIKGARFFVIKSYSEDDIHRSIKYGIWCSTEHGNKRLDNAFKEREGKGPIYLFFSVNGSGHFCGLAQMMSPVDYSRSSGVWSQDKWKGQFQVRWIYVKDVPNSQLRHIRLENNENKPVTNSRDTQEVPLDKGRQVLMIVHKYKHSTCIFDDFVHYEKRQEEEEQRKT